MKQYKKARNNSKKQESIERIKTQETIARHKKHEAVERNTTQQK